ncbi:MAG: hypothetical protein AB7O52_14335 [Planctomycetota bacterium]
MTSEDPPNDAPEDSLTDSFEDVDADLVRWSIPADVPRRLFGGLVPELSTPVGLRVAARVLHSLIVRCAPATIYVVGRAAGEPADSQTQIALDLPSVDEARARKLARAGDFTVVAGDPRPAWLADFGAVTSVIAALAPGCGIVPIAVNTAGDALRLGKILGASDDTVVVALSCLTRYGEPFQFAPAGLGPGAGPWIRANDARMVGLVARLEAERIMDEALEHHNATAAPAIVAAVLASRQRGATCGTVVEYTHSGVDLVSAAVDGSVGLVGALFGAPSHAGRTRDDDSP